MLKVREDQEKRRIEEEPAQQIGQQSGTEVPPQISQPASYVSPQPTQYSTQMPAQPASQQSIQSPNYSTPQPTQNTTVVQAVSPATHSGGQVPAPPQSQSVASIQPESDDPESDQHQHPQQAGGGIYGMQLYLRGSEMMLKGCVFCGLTLMFHLTAGIIGDKIPGSSILSEDQSSQTGISYGSVPSQQLQSQVSSPQTQNDQTQQQQLTVVSVASVNLVLSMFASIFCSFTLQMFLSVVER